MPFVPAPRSIPRHFIHWASAGHSILRLGQYIRFFEPTTLRPSTLDIPRLALLLPILEHHSATPLPLIFAF